MYHLLLVVIGERAKRARYYQGEQMEIGDIYIYMCIYIHIWYVQDTLVARAQWNVMWEELSVSHF